MRDYLYRNLETGATRTVGQMSTAEIRDALAEPIYPGGLNQPPITAEAARERLRLELEIRAMGLSV